MNFPTVTEYEDAISLGKKSFKTLDVKFEMSNPNARIWNFGAGQFAVVFKAKIEEKYYAIRCFQHATKKSLEKYSVMSEYLKKKKIPFLSKFDYYENEIIVGSNKYPVLVMDWVEGIDIHDFISENLNSKYWLLELQKSLLSLSIDLEKNGIGHGDFQKGNVIVQKKENTCSLMLIDYDGMFVKPMLGELSTELGKPDIQHPNREKTFFNEKIDRFSIWLIITCIEALKYDKTLWNRISDGGYNDESNFLFTYEDLKNNSNSKLFHKLLNSSNNSVKQYSLLLMDLCNQDIDNVYVPELLDSVLEEKNVPYDTIIEKEKIESKKTNTINTDKLNESKKDDVIKIKSNTKKGGKKFDVLDDLPLGKRTAGKEFDKVDPKNLNNAEKLAHTIRLKNMFLGLFVLTSILSIFLIFSYSEKLSDYFGKERQYEESYKSVQSLKSDLDEMTLSRDNWQSDYYDMESKKDYWSSSYYNMQSQYSNMKASRDSYKYSYEFYYSEYNRYKNAWDSHYCYDRSMCSCW